MTKLVLVKDLKTEWRLLGAYDGHYDHVYLAADVNILHKISTTFHELGHKLIQVMTGYKDPTTIDGLFDFCTSWIDMPVNTGKSLAKIGFRTYYYLRVHKYDKSFIQCYDNAGNLVEVIKSEE